MSVWYRAGTVAVTNGSKTVTGTNTQWLNLMFGVMPGTTFYGPDGKPYEIDRVVSGTSLLLITNYSGATASAQAYSVDPTRSGSVASLAAQTSEVLKFSQEQFTQMQTWVTGPANADVTLKAPSGQTVVVPSWKKISDTVSGQAAVAKQEADKAIAAAALAGDIVAQSALPLPDVWAPLSDSLRLITGYGRDVLVGADVVARMVNFSRNSTATYIGKDGQLKTAAANEPRFEKEGLLIEGQSTNLWWNQNAPGVSAINAPLESVTLPTGVAGNAYKVTPNPTDVSYVRASFAQQTGQLTLSCFARRADGSNEMPTIYTGHSGALSEKASGIYLGAGWWRMYRVMTSPSGNTGFGFAATTIDTIPVHICFFQLEALPFASSYIPTAGAAVTRAADICWLNVAGNHFANGTHAFYASCKNCGAVSTTLTMRFIHVEGVSQHFSVRATGNERRLGYLNNADTTFASGVTSFEGVIAVAPGRLSKMGSFTAQTSPLFVTEDVSTKQLYIGSQGAGIHSIFGHVRNLRIWSKPLTNDQIKAVA